ncbi:3-hydroxyacyl-CoA dehydrogenase, partial [Operophtera brumata]
VVICDLPTSTGQDTAKQLGENVAFVPIDVRQCSTIRSKKHYKRRWISLDASTSPSTAPAWHADGQRGVIVNTASVAAFDG